MHVQTVHVKGHMMRADEVYREVWRRAGGTDDAVADVAGVSRTTALRWRQRIERGGVIDPQPANLERMRQWLKDLPEEKISDFERGYDMAVSMMRSLLERLHRIKPSDEVFASADALRRAGLLREGSMRPKADENRSDGDEKHDSGGRTSGHG